MAGSVDKVYSEALLEIAREDGNADALYEEISTLREIFEANPELSDALSAPTLADQEKQALLENVFKGRITDISYNFLCVLTEKRRIRSFSSIADAFRKGYYEMSGIAEAKVITAVPLKADAKDKLIKKLEKMYGKKIVLEEKVDEAILGGMIVTVGDNMLDGSVKTRLENMHEQIRDMVAG